MLFIYITGVVTAIKQGKYIFIQPQNENDGNGLANLIKLSEGNNDENSDDTDDEEHGFDDHNNINNGNNNDNNRKQTTAAMVIDYSEQPQRIRLKGDHTGMTGVYPKKDEPNVLTWDMVNKMDYNDVSKIQKQLRQQSFKE